MGERIYSNASIWLCIGLLIACQSRATETNTHSIKYDTATQLINQREVECGSLPYGEKIACYLQVDYESTVDSCSTSSSSPAFRCSGIVLRGTDPDLNRDYYSWNPSPASQTSGGVSFSYLRADSKYEKLAFGYVSGFIFYPILYSPDDQDSDIEVLCSYPIDGGTDVRDNHGCGVAPQHPNGSPCYTQGVDTGSEWVEHYHNNGGESDYQDRCAFILDSDNLSVDPENEFNLSIDAMNILGNDSFNEQNELRLATWEQDKKDIPIEAFFYLSGSDAGLSSAQKDQDDFFKFSNKNRIIPIIRITLPDAPLDDAKFEYIESDQIYIEEEGGAYSGCFDRNGNPISGFQTGSNTTPNLIVNCNFSSEELEVGVTNLGGDGYPDEFYGDFISGTSGDLKHFNAFGFSYAYLVSDKKNFQITASLFGNRVDVRSGVFSTNKNGYNQCLFNLVEIPCITYSSE